MAVQKNNSELLLKQDYLDIIEKLITETDLEENIMLAYNFYKTNNPGFLMNLLKHCQKGVLAERVIINAYFDITKDQIQLLTGVISKGINYDIDIKEVEDAKITLQQIEFKNLKLVSSGRVTEKLVYLNFSLTVLVCLYTNRDEDTFSILTINEKLYLLDALIKAKLLDKEGTSKELEVVLSLITGHNPVSLEKPLKERKNWFNYYKNPSPQSIKARIDSLNRMKDQLKVRKISSGEIVDGIDTEIGDAEREKKIKEAKKEDEKKNNRIKITKG